MSSTDLTSATATEHVLDLRRAASDHRRADQARGCRDSVRDRLVRVGHAVSGRVGRRG